MARRGPDVNPVDRIRKDIAADSLRPVYLLRGGNRQEPLLARRAYDMLCAAAVAGGPRGFNEQAFQGEKSKAEAIVSACNHLPMMAPRRLIVVRNVNRLKQDQQDVLAAYCQAPSETTVLVLSEDPATGPGKGQPKAIDGRRKLAKASKKSGQDCAFKRLYGRALEQWVVAEAATFDKRIEGRFADYLEAALGNDLGQIYNALSLASLFVGDAEVIRTEDLEQVVSGRRQEALWDLLDAVGERSMVGAMHNLQVLYGQGEEAFSLLNLLKKRVRELLKAEKALASGMGQREALSAAGIAPNMTWKYERQLGRYRAMELRRGLSRLLLAESDLKGGSRVDPRWSVEWAIRDIVARP